MDKGLLALLQHDATDCSSIVDYGCGPADYLREMDASYRLGVDLVLPNPLPMGIDFVRADIREFVGHRTAHLGMFIDSLEHLESIEGAEVLSNAMDCHQKLIVFTPEGFWRQNGTPENPHQEHRSGWTRAELEALGFVVTRITDIGLAPASLYAVWER